MHIQHRCGMTGRYEISDSQWQLIEDIFSPAQSMVRPRKDDRQMLNDIFWVFCSGAKWRDLPERYGPWSTVYARFRHGVMTVPLSQSYRDFNCGFAKMA